MTDIMDTIRTLANMPGASGDEGEVRAAILNMITPLADHAYVDPPGNIIAFKKGRRDGGCRVLYCAHMDEVGFIITFIEDSGLLRFAPVGGIDSRVVLGKTLEIGRGRVRGVIGTKAMHQQDEKERAATVPFDKLYIDIGARDKADAEAHVSAGDRAVFYSPPVNIGEGGILAKALDDRAGCALLIDMMKDAPPYDCHFAFTVNEEIGCVGAAAAGYTVAPDICVVVEATTAADIPGTTADKQVCALGKGPVVSFMDKGAAYDRELFGLALETARAHSIPVQVKAGVYGGNDARTIQTARGGVKALAVSLPCRYLHSPSNMMLESDIRDTLALLKHLQSAIHQ